MDTTMLNFWYRDTSEPALPFFVLGGVEHIKNFCTDCPPGFTPTPPPYFKCVQCKATKCPPHWRGVCTNQDQDHVCESPSNHRCGACEACAPNGEFWICSHACQRCLDARNGVARRTCVDVCAECALEMPKGSNKV